MQKYNKKVTTGLIRERSKSVKKLKYVRIFELYDFYVYLAGNNIPIIAC
jgi:hypothetical protein